MSSVVSPLAGLFGTSGCDGSSPGFDPRLLAPSALIGPGWELLIKGGEGRGQTTRLYYVTDPRY